jgi:hypothetical protein
MSTAATSHTAATCSRSRVEMAYPTRTSAGPERFTAPTTYRRHSAELDDRPRPAACPLKTRQLINARGGNRAKGDGRGRPALQHHAGARAVLLRLGAIARRTCLLSPILGDALENESAGTDEVPPSGQRCSASHVNSRYLSSVHARADTASRIVPISSASNPAVSARPRTTSAQSPGRHNRRSPRSSCEPRRADAH